MGHSCWEKDGQDSSFRGDRQKGQEGQSRLQAVSQDLWSKHNRQLLLAPWEAPEPDTTARQEMAQEKS